MSAPRTSTSSASIRSAVTARSIGRPRRGAGVSRSWRVSSSASMSRRYTALLGRLRPCSPGRPVRLLAPFGAVGEALEALERGLEAVDELDAVAEVLDARRAGGLEHVREAALESLLLDRVTRDGVAVAPCVAVARLRGCLEL